MKTILFLICLALLGSCTPKKISKVTNVTDYERFLVSEPIKTTSKYFELWNSKIKPDSMQLTSFGIVAGEYTRFFNETGDITYLKKAEQALKKATDIAAIGKSGYYRSLARNYISQHRFKEALSYAERAYQLKSGLKDSQSLLFDVHMELGHYKIAQNYLDSISNVSDFGFLIRASKWNDHIGDLDTAIRFMEEAKQKAETSKNKNLQLWSYTNLADFYGHAGRIHEAYQHYLKALAIDATNAYAKKGIAWIVFSHEKNPSEALRILDAVTALNQTPDYQLMKADIADYMKNDTQKYIFLDTYIQSVQDEAYGSMYNAHTIKLYLENTEQYELALDLAVEELKHRTTPETYDLLAYSYLKNGDLTSALDLMKTYVEGKTHEPEALYHMAKIYKANRVEGKVESLKEELRDTAFEMGPSFSEALAKL